MSINFELALIPSSVLMKRYGINKNTWCTWLRVHGLRFHKFGKKYLFEPKVIEQFEKDHLYKWGQKEPEKVSKC